MSQQARLIEYLSKEMSVPDDAIALGQRYAGALPNLLPIALWKYGFVTCEQVSEIFDWLEAAQPSQYIL